jgi:16S rRNA processing protein RimM
MSFPKSDSADSLVSVAKAVRTRGLKGVIVAELLTDFPERFEGLTSLIALAPGGDRQAVELEDFWLQNDRIIFKLAGVDTIAAAEAFRDYEFCVPDEERVALEQDQYYDFELVGCEVWLINDSRIGKVQSVLKTGGTEILLIDADNGGEVMVPMAKSIVVEIDVTSKKILIDPPEGLLELS